MLYTERHGIRKPIEKTYIINKDMYSLLLNYCMRYQKNLTHLFKKNCYDDFTDQNYETFDERAFLTRIRIKIPELYFYSNGDIGVPSYEEDYNQYALLDLIEFFSQNIEDISEKWNNERYRNYKYIDCLGTYNVSKQFQDEINELFEECGLLYKVTEDEIVERVIIDSPLTLDIENDISKVNEKGLRDLVRDAIALYKTPGPAARQDSVEKIWDALERLKTYYATMDKKKSIEKIVNDMAGGNQGFINMFNKEFSELTYIGNNYRIRHHETNKYEIIDERFYDYLFNRCLSLIAITIQYLE